MVNTYKLYPVNMSTFLSHTEILGEDQTHDVHDLHSDTHVHSISGLPNSELKVKVQCHAWHAYY
jgi:hypothetical protein